jgi:RNA polymerase sigma-70 factor (ECF subfamily)
MSVALFDLALEDAVPPSPGAAGRAETDAVRSAVEEHERALLGYAHSLLEDWGLAQDVVQDTFLRYHRETRDRPLEHPRAWLYTVCRNRAMDALRKGRRISRLPEAHWESLADERQPSPDETLEREDEWCRLLRLVAGLPAHQREVIRLKFQADLSYKEIAEVTGLTVGHVGYLLHHGLKRLRTLLEAERGSSPS